MEFKLKVSEQKNEGRRNYIKLIMLNPIRYKILIPLEKLRYF